MLFLLPKLRLQQPRWLLLLLPLRLLKRLLLPLLSLKLPLLSLRRLKPPLLWLRLPPFQLLKRRPLSPLLP
jgi:hypothetical protein